MLGPTAQKEVKKKSWMWCGHSFADVCVYTIVVSGGRLLRQSCDHNQEILGKK